MSSIAINLEEVSRTANVGVVVLGVLFGLAGHFVSFYFHFLTVAFFLVVLLNFHWRHVQTSHTLLANFGFMAQFRYIAESVGPEFRQYLFASDTEERPFSRVERAEVYRKAKGIDSSAAFGSLLDYDRNEIKLRHSFYPVDHDDIEPFDVAVGAAWGIDSAYHITRPIMISAMSYGALGENAVRALARGAKLAGAIMNTGEGGNPKYHLMEGCDLIFQIGTAKFGVRHEDGRLDEDRLAALAAMDQIKMIEIRLSQVGEGASLEGAAIDAFPALLREYVEAAHSNPGLEIKDNLFNIVRHEHGQPLLDGCTGYGCGAAFNFVAVLPDGEVHACRKFPSPLGNLLDSSLSEIYASPLAEQYRQGCRACSGCALRPACGGCMAVAHGMGLDVFEERDPYCFFKDAPR